VVSVSFPVPAAGKSSKTRAESAAIRMEPESRRAGLRGTLFPIHIFIWLLWYLQVRGRVKSTMMQRDVAEVERFGTRTAFVKYFSNECKKSLAFLDGQGVASATVQGLKVARRSLDGEAMRGFRKLVWSESAKCGRWRCGSVSDLFCLKHSFQIPFTQTERDSVALSTQRFTERN
jgi:hypothetical protein